MQQAADKLFRHNDLILSVSMEEQDDFKISNKLDEDI